MKLFKEIDFKTVLWFFLHALIIVDIALITFAMLFSLPENVSFKIMLFDFCVCVILLAEWLINFQKSNSKTEFLKQKGNWISLIASIPFDVLLPAVIPGINLLRYLRLLKLLRVIVLFNRFFDGFERFIKKSNLDKILGGVFLTIIIFTVLLYIFGPSYGLFDDFYFVIVTLTTVGYGDVIPVTFNEKIISLILIFVGIFVFSTITAAISSYLTDRLMSSEDEKIEDKLDSVIEQLNKVEKNFESLHNENKELKKEIHELNEIIKS